MEISEVNSTPGTKYLPGYLLHSSQFCYLVTDGAGQFLFANSCFRKKFFKLSNNLAATSIGNIILASEKESCAFIMHQCLAEPGVARSIELHLPLLQDNYSIVRWEVSAWTNGDGEINLHWAGINIDEINEQAKSYRLKAGELIEYSKNYDQTLEGVWLLELRIPVSAAASPEEILEHGKQHGFIADCNDKLAQMYGYEKANEMIGFSLTDFVDYTDPVRAEYLKKFIRDGFVSARVETKEFDRYGKTLYILNSMTGIVKNGMLMSVRGSQQDITAQRVAEEKIHYFAKLLESVSDIIISMDYEHNIVSWNKAAEEIYGYPAEQMIGRKMQERLHFEFQDISRDEFFDIIHSKGEWRGEVYVTNRSGKPLTVLATVTQIKNEAGQVIGFVSVSKDITEKRKAEEQLRFQAGIYNNISDAITTSDMNLIVTSWNKGAEEIYGIPAPEIVGKRVKDLLQMNYHNSTREEVLKIVYENKVWEGEVSFIRKSDQTERTVLATLTHQYNELKQPIGFIAVNKDITERKKNEDRLRYQTAILNNVSDLIMTTSFDMTILSWNKKAEEVVGYPAEEAIGKFLGDIVRPDYGNITPSQSAKELEEKGFWQGEISFLSNEGIKKHVLHTACYLLDEKGKRIAIIGTGKDITERKKAEEKLQQSELFYRNLITHSLDGVLVTNEKGVIRFASPSITEILGYDVDETIGKLTFDFAHPEDRDLSASALQDEVDRTPQRKFIRVRLRKKSGVYIWCIVRGHNLMQNPYVQGIMVYFYDDTLRKKAEDALIESKKRLLSQATILQNVNDVIVTTDLDLTITSWNKIAEELSGITADTAIGKQLRDIFPLDFAPYSMEQITELIISNNTWQGEVSFFDRNGEKRYLLQTNSLLQDEEGKSIGILSVGNCITERKKIEAMLQESELFYRNMISHSLDGIVMVNSYGKITYCGPSAVLISGYEPEQLIGRNLFEFVHSDDIEVAKEAFILELNKQSSLCYIFLRLRHSDGDWRWCSVRAHNLMNAPGIHAMIIYFTEETQRKLTEDKLRESEERFRNMINNLKLGVILQNEKTEMLVCNQAALDLLGLSEDQLLGKTPPDPEWNVIHEDGSDFPGNTHPVQIAIQTQKTVSDVVMGVYRPSKGDRVWLLVNAEPVLDSNKNIINVICSFTDISEQRRLSQQLIEQEIQKQKQLMQATIDGQENERKEIGLELHDNISQHITTTRLYLEVARDKAEGELRGVINLAHKGLLDTVAEMRQLSQSLVPPSLSDIGLVESIHDLCNPLKNTHTFTIEFQYDQFNETLLPENMKLMLFRIIQEQISNIIRHAHANTIHISLQTAEGRVILSVDDNGMGFDPKSVKKGHGFDNITNRASLFGGELKIAAAPGKGCFIRVTIPLQ